MGHKREEIKFKREFFDRDYRLGEAYGRALKYAKPYRFRIVLGLLCGILTAAYCRQAVGAGDYLIRFLKLALCYFCYKFGYSYIYGTAAYTGLVLTVKAA